jgi:large subunit ribosomal protein L31
MKKHSHPPYRQVVFRDRSAGLAFRTGSTLDSAQTIEFEGGTYPLVDVEISSASHPFWSGRERIVDTEGRVERFRRRYLRGGAR